MEWMNKLPKVNWPVSGRAEIQTQVLWPWSLSVAIFLQCIHTSYTRVNGGDTRMLKGGACPPSGFPPCFQLGYRVAVSHLGESR